LLVREVDAAVEDMIASRKGCIAKRLGDGPVATFLSTNAAVKPLSTRHMRFRPSRSEAPLVRIDRDRVRTGRPTRLRMYGLGAVP